MHRGFWKENVHVREYFEDQDVDGIIILKWIFKNRMGGLALD
jgi:hypothetical protein